MTNKQQTRLVSLVETCVNVAIGFVVSASVWPVVAVWQGFDYTFASNMQVTAFFTVLSVARGYAVRRFFANGVHQLAAQVAGAISKFKQENEG